jgi:VanZ family protein
LKIKHIFRNISLFVKPIVWLAIIAVLCFMPAEDIPQTPLFRIPHFDKLVHFGMYFILVVLLSRPVKTVRLPVCLTTLLISVFIGGLIEVLQVAITSTRSANWGDFFADFAGAIIGLLVYGMLVEGKHWEKYV